MARAAKRGNAKTIDEQVMGPEPDYTVMPEDPAVRKTALGNGLRWYGYYFDSSESAPVVHKYAQDKLSETDLKALKACPNWKINSSTRGLIRMINRGWVPNERELEWINNNFKECIEIGRDIVVVEEEKRAEVPRLSPVERQRKKIHETIMCDLDGLEDQWCEGNYSAKIEVYKLFKDYNLKGTMPAQMVQDWAQKRLEEYICVRDKEDEQCVEAYSHMNKRQINSVIKTLEGIINEAESFSVANKAKRVVRKKKVHSADKQVSKLQFKREDTDFKIASVDPTAVVGAMRLFAFNTKSRELIEYVSLRREGFEVKGTSLQHFDVDTSRKIKLRKPEEILPIALTKTPRQVDNAWSKLKTKTSPANGRFNRDIVLLRILNK